MFQRTRVELTVELGWDGSVLKVVYEATTTMIQMIQVDIQMILWR